LIKGITIKIPSNKGYVYPAFLKMINQIKAHKTANVMVITIPPTENTVPKSNEVVSFIASVSTSL